MCDRLLVFSSNPAWPAEIKVDLPHPLQSSRDPTFGSFCYSILCAHTQRAEPRAPAIEGFTALGVWHDPHAMSRQRPFRSDQTLAVPPYNGTRLPVLAGTRQLEADEY